MKMPDDQELQKALREALAGMPAAIVSGVLDPEVSAGDRLKWVEVAVRVFRAPNSRPITRLDIENKRNVATILKAAVPALEKIRQEHQSERLSKTAARYLRYIAVKVGSGKSPAVAQTGHYTARKSQARQRRS
jgi:hypothetical protein